MVIYEIGSADALNVDGICVGTRGGRRYRIRVCGGRMDARRRQLLADALNRAILPDSNVTMPDIFLADRRYYSAEVIDENELHGCPSSALCLLGLGHRRRIVLSAVSAVATLERANIVHGSLSPECFRLCRASDGSFYMRLTGLARAGIRQVMCPDRRGDMTWQAPNGPDDAGSLSATEDTYALGMCIHYWLTGDTPVWAEVSERQISLLSDQLGEALIPVVGMMLAPKPEQRPLPSAVLRMFGGKITATSKTRYAQYTGGQYSADYAGDVTDALLLEDPTCTLDFDRDAAKEMRW